MSRTKLYILLTVLSLAGYSWLGWNYAEMSGSSSTPTVCLFRTVTHLPCPSCGTTRALVLLASGDIRNSFLTNPLGALLALGLVVIPLWIVADTLRNTDGLFRWYMKAERLLAGNK